MNKLNRRDLLALTSVAALGVAPPLARSQQTANFNAQSFLNGGMKGFAIDKVISRANDAAYFNALLTTKSNIARIFFSFKKCQNCTQYGRSPADVDGLKKILDLVRPTGLKIVVVGIFDDQDKPSFWSGDALRSSFVSSWRWFAETYQNDTALAGLDLMNEPNPPGKLSDGQAIWRSLAEQAIGAIRTVGVTLPIVFEGTGGGQAIGMRDLVPFKDTQVVYSLHLYTPHDITHQKVAPIWPRTIPYPAGAEWQLKDAVIDVGLWDRKRLEMALKDVISFQQRYKVPIYVGEFSCVRWAPSGSARRYVEDSLAIFKQYGWSWCYHEFRGWPGWDAEIDSMEKNASTRSFDAPTMKVLLAELAGNR